MPRREKEIENLKWFCKSLFKECPPTKEDFEEYFAYSERGTRPRQRGIREPYNALLAAKRMRGIIIHELWESSFYSRGGEGWWPGFYGLFTEEDGSPIPAHIQKYIAREIFAGQSRELADKVYESICQKSAAAGVQR